MKTQSKQSFKCIDGPFKGRTIWLGADAHTFIFAVGNWTGQYIRGKWYAQVS